MQTTTNPASSVGSAETQPVSPRTSVIATAFVLAPALMLAASLADIAGYDPSGGVLQFYASAAYFLVFLTLTQHLSPVMPRAAALLTVTGAIGAAAGAGFGFDRIHATLAHGVFLVDDGGVAGSLVGKVAGPLLPLTVIGLGAVLLRVGTGPRWAAAVLVLAGLLFPVSRIGDLPLLAVADDVLYLVALVPLGLAVARGRALFAVRAGDVGSSGVSEK